MIQQMAKTAGRLDWKGWLLGAMSAIVGGGAGAVSGGFGSALVDLNDPDHFALQPKHLFYTALICFAFTAFISLMTYLHNHPIPDAEPVNQPQGS